MESTNKKNVGFTPKPKGNPELIQNDLGKNNHAVWNLKHIHDDIGAFGLHYAPIGIGEKNDN